MFFLEYLLDANTDWMGTGCGGDGRVTGPVMWYLEAASVPHKAHGLQTSLGIDSEWHLESCHISIFRYLITWAAKKEANSEKYVGETENCSLYKP